MDEKRIEEMIGNALYEAKRDGMAQGIVWAAVVSLCYLVAGILIGYAI